MTMSNTRRTIRQTLTIARRDFIATVFTPIFLLFLFAPVIMGSFGAIGGIGAATVADGSADKSRIVAIVAPTQRSAITAADTSLRGVFRNEEAPPKLSVVAPAGDPATQARAAFDSRDFDAAAVLFGPLERPQIIYGPRGNRAADYLAVLAGQTLAAERLGGNVPKVIATKTALTRARASMGGQHQSAFLATFGIFFLTLFLSGQVVGTMAEERNSKVIEVLAAAVPLESVFFGKLIGMFGVAVLFVIFWGTVLGQLSMLLPAPIAAGMAELTPAVGGPMFAVLFAAYFTMAYLLLGAVFLAVGAQASTMREIQMLSLPITFLQAGMFGLAAAAASHPGTTLSLVAELFPLSSPFAMAGHAANAPELWPHLLALAWQALWVAIFIAIGARMFRRGVLQSGSGKSAWRFWAKA